MQTASQDVFVFPSTRHRQLLSSRRTEESLPQAARPALTASIPCSTTNLAAINSQQILTVNTLNYVVYHLRLNQHHHSDCTNPILQLTQNHHSHLVEQIHLHLLAKRHRRCHCFPYRFQILPIPFALLEMPASR